MNLRDNPQLDENGFTPIGEVVEGMDVVDAIAQVKTGRAGGHSDVPVETVLIESAKVVEAGS